MTTWLFYRASCKAEDYTVIAGNLSNISGDLNRLYNNGEPGELLLDGEPTGVYIKMVLVADKPFIRHVCGLLSHNADAFGAPFCECCDETDRPALYDFTKCTKSHYGSTTFADLCHRAHCAAWEALGQKEPAYWYFKCPCCPAEFGTDHGGKAALDAIDEKLFSLENEYRAREQNGHAKKHTWRSSCAAGRSCPSTTSCMIQCMLCTTRPMLCSTRRCTSTSWSSRRMPR